MRVSLFKSRFLVTTFKICISRKLLFPAFIVGEGGYFSSSVQLERESSAVRGRTSSRIRSSSSCRCHRPSRRPRHGEDRQRRCDSLTRGHRSIWRLLISGWNETAPDLSLQTNVNVNDTVVVVVKAYVHCLQKNVPRLARSSFGINKPILMLFG